MGRGAISAGVAQTLGRISGFVRDVVFASVFGAGAVADAFFVAFRVPNLFRELLAEGTLSNVFVPLFAETNEKEGRAKAWALANAVLGLLLVVLGVLTFGIYWFSEPLVLVVASGFADTPGKVELAAWLTRLLAPFLAGISIASVFGGMLNVHGRFFLPARPELAPRHRWGTGPIRQRLPLSCARRRILPGVGGPKDGIASLHERALPVDPVSCSCELSISLPFRVFAALSGIG